MFMEDVQYQHCLDLLDNKKQKSDISKEFSEWTKQEFDINLIEFFCEYDKTCGFRLHLAVWEQQDENKFYDENQKLYIKEEIKQKFKGKFSKLAKKHNVFPEFHDESKYFMIKTSLAEEIREKTLYKASNDIKALRIKNLWHLDASLGTVDIFFETEQQIDQFKACGYLDEVHSMILECVLKYDDYNVFTNEVSCVFTSKQNLDEHYEGRLFYWYKR